MRILTAILLLFILLFNCFGYQLFSVYLQKRATITLEARLDRQEYAEKDLIELKIAVSIPYQNNQESFERYDGEIEVNGTHYKYVKRRIYNDSLVLLCLPAKEKTKIQHASNDFFRLVNDLRSAPSENTGKGTAAILKIGLSEFLPNENKSLVCTYPPVIKAFFPASKTAHHLADYSARPEIPPEA